MTIHNLPRGKNPKLCEATLYWNLQYTNRKQKCKHSCYSKPYRDGKKKKKRKKRKKRKKKDQFRSM